MTKAPTNAIPSLKLCGFSNEQINFLLSYASAQRIFDKKRSLPNNSECQILANHLSSETVFPSGMREITGVQIIEYFSELTGRDQKKVSRKTGRIGKTTRVEKLEQKIEVHDFKTVNTYKLNQIDQDQASYVEPMSEKFLACKSSVKLAIIPRLHVFGNKRATEVACGHESSCSDKECERLVCEKIDMVGPVLSYLNEGDQKKPRLQIRKEFLNSVQRKSGFEVAERQVCNYFNKMFMQNIGRVEFPTDFVEKSNIFNPQQRLSLYQIGKKTGGKLKPLEISDLVKKLNDKRYGGREKRVTKHEILKWFIEYRKEPVFEFDSEKCTERRVSEFLGLDVATVQRVVSG